MISSFCKTDQLIYPGNDHQRLLKTQKETQPDRRIQHHFDKKKQKTKPESDKASLDPISIYRKYRGQENTLNGIMGI